MLLSFPFFLILIVGLSNTQINLYSDIELFSAGTQFQPINSVELLSTILTSSIIDCAQACNQNLQCRTFDYDPQSLLCRLFEGSIDTGQITPSASSARRVGAIRFPSYLYTAIGQPCVQCIQNRYLICTSNNTCQCPVNSVWNGVRCVNQAYEDGYCLNDQWCRNDTGFICSKLQFCTKYSCSNMTIAKVDLPGNDLRSNTTSNYQSCCAWCRSYPGCRAFTWVIAPGLFYGMCYLKYSAAIGGSPSTDHISAYY